MDDINELQRKASLWDGAPVKEWKAVVEAARKVVADTHSHAVAEKTDEGVYLKALATIPLRSVADLETAIAAFDASK